MSGVTHGNWWSEPASKRARLSLLPLVAILSALAFWPASGAGLIQYDDPGFLQVASGWRGLGAEHIRWMFSTFVIGHYQPLTYLSYAIEFTLLGATPEDRPQVYHVTNIVLHACNSALTVLLCVSLMRAASRADTGIEPAPSTRAMWLGACVAGLLWGVHPLRTESVAWITERRDVLSVLFLLLAALAYVRWACAPVQSNARWYIATLALLLLSLLSKAWGMSFFVIATLMDVLPLRRLSMRPWEWLRAPSRRVLIEKLPMALMGLVFMVVAGKAQGATRYTVRTLEEWGVVQRFCQACYGVVFYVWKTILPTGLSALHELPRDASPADPKYLVPIVIVFAGVVVLWMVRRSMPHVVIAVLAYGVLVAPVLGVMQSGIQLVAERYAYLSTIPLFIVAGGGLMVLARLGTLSGMNVLIVGACIFGASSLLMVRSWRQSMLWHDALYLWQDALENGHEGPLLRTVYANRLSQLDRLDEAMPHYQRAVELDPKMGDAWFGMGTIHRIRKEYAQAERCYQEAALHPKERLRAQVALGLLYIMPEQLNRPQDGLNMFLESVRTLEEEGNPDRIGRPYLLVGAAYGTMGNDAKAAEYLRRAMQYADTRDEAAMHLRDMGLLR